jgi:hypothetical protein
MAKKSGQGFEDLIALIQTCVHKSAIIKPNERIKDIDTGKARQIDITIRLSDGPTEFLGIVEVRDRKRPIGVRYVEEISGKLRSVRADAAFLVSRSGFTKTAIEKAKQIGIRVLTYDEAKSEDWSGWLDCRTFGIIQAKYDNAAITLFGYGAEKDIIPSPNVIDILNKNGLNAKIILDEYGNQIVSLLDLVTYILNASGQEFHENIPSDGTHVKRMVLFQGKFKPTLWLETDQGIVQIGNVRIDVELFKECNEFPLKLMKYRVPNSIQSIAEIATSDVEILGKKYRIDLIAPGAGKYIPAGTMLTGRKIKLD